MELYTLAEFLDACGMWNRKYITKDILERDYGVSPVKTMGTEKRPIYLYDKSQCEQVEDPFNVPSADADGWKVLTPGLSEVLKVLRKLNTQVYESCVATDTLRAPSPHSLFGLLTSLQRIDRKLDQLSTNLQRLERKIDQLSIEWTFKPKTEPSIQTKDPQP